MLAAKVWMLLGIVVFVAGDSWRHYSTVRELTPSELSQVSTSLLSVPLRRFRFLYDTAGHKDR